MMLYIYSIYISRWRHIGHNCASNYRRLDCLHNRLLRRRSKKISKLRVTLLCEGNSPVAGEFTAQRASNVEKVSIWWRHHGYGQNREVHTIWPYGICLRNELISQKVCYTSAVLLTSIWNCLMLTPVTTVALQIDKFTSLGAFACLNLCLLDFMISLKKIGFR